MRVLVMTNLYPNPFDPHRAPFNKNRLQRVAEQHEVRIIAPIAWTDELAARRRNTFDLPRNRQVMLDGIFVEHPRYWFTPGMLRGWYGCFYRWSVRRSFECAFTEFRPDVLYAPWAYPDGWAAVELGHRAGIPVVLKVHGSDILLLDRHPAKKPGTVDALRRAEHIVAVSQDLGNRVVTLGASPDRVTVVYDGVDLNQFHPGSRIEARARLGLEPNEPMVLFVGNLIPLKGVDLLVEVCARLMTSGLRFTCHLIGQGPLRPRLEVAIRRKGLEGRICLHGALSNNQLPDWYRAANVCVLPSHSEGVPNVLLEAAACETPFIASRVGGIPEIAGLGISRLVSPGDAAQLTEALRQFLTGPIPSRDAGAPVVRSRAESVAQMVRLLEDIVEDHQRRRETRSPALAVH